MTKEKFKELYENEMQKLSKVESAINSLGFQMNGKCDLHKNTLSAFETYAKEHDKNGFYYGFVANNVVENWKSFMEVCFQLWNFPRMTKDSLKTFYDYIYSAFEMMEEGTFNFQDYLDEQFQTYCTNLEKFFGKEITNDIFNTFSEYLKSKNDWDYELFKC